MSDRFHLAELPDVGGDGVLEGQELHHLRSVCRATVDQTVEIFDGAGRVGLARILSLDRRQAVLRVERIETVPNRDLPLTIAAPLPKGDRAGTMIEKLTELGVRRYVPLETARSVVHPGTGKLDKLRRVAIEAAKQSHREYLPEICEVRTYEDWLAKEEVGWLLDPKGDRLPESAPPTERMAVGPEGGWTDQEIDLARERGWSIVRIPGTILRIETAVLALAAWSRLRTDDSGPGPKGSACTDR